MNWKRVNTVVLSYLLLVNLLGLTYGQISFGWGLGDGFAYLLLWGVTLFHALLTAVHWKKKDGRWIFLSLVFLGFALWFSLRATIWRGAEYAWNGHLFYVPCRTEIVIRNAVGEEAKKIKTISMCSMTYFSEFTGKWNGTQVELTAGELKIPELLERYLDDPVATIWVTPKYDRQKIDSTYQFDNDFEVDTLQRGREYPFEGTIYEIIDRQPVFELRISAYESGPPQ